jgi:hypothetical protein
MSEYDEAHAHGVLTDVEGVGDARADAILEALDDAGFSVTLGAPDTLTDDVRRHLEDAYGILCDDEERRAEMRAELASERIVECILLLDAATRGGRE